MKLKLFTHLDLGCLEERVNEFLQDHPAPTIVDRQLVTHCNPATSPTDHYTIAIWYHPESVEPPPRDLPPAE